MQSSPNQKSQVKWPPHKTSSLPGALIFKGPRILFSQLKNGKPRMRTDTDATKLSKKATKSCSQLLTCSRPLRNKDLSRNFKPSLLGHMKYRRSSPQQSTGSGFP